MFSFIILGIRLPAGSTMGKLDPKVWQVTLKWLQNDKAEATLHKCPYRKLFWKCAANLQESTNDEVQFQQSCKATFLKSHFGIGVLLYICYIFLEHLSLRTPLEGCFYEGLIFIGLLDLLLSGLTNLDLTFLSVLLTIKTCKKYLCSKLFKFNALVPVSLVLRHEFSWARQTNSQKLRKKYEICWWFIFKSCITK